MIVDGKRVTLVLGSDIKKIAVKNAKKMGLNLSAYVRLLILNDKR